MRAALWFSAVAGTRAREAHRVPASGKPRGWGRPLPSGGSQCVTTLPCRKSPVSRRSDAGHGYYPARKLFGRDVPSGAVAVVAASVLALTKTLP